MAGVAVRLPKPHREGYPCGLTSPSVRLVVEPLLREKFPGLDAHLVRLDGLRVQERDDRLDGFVPVLLQEFRDHLRLETLKDEPILRAYRDFYWRVGIDPTKIRPASEALLRRVLQGKELPRINTLVDAYNLASMKTRISIAAFDASHLHGDITMRNAREGEGFLGIGMDEPVVLRGGEVVCEDAEGLVAIYPYRDAHRTRVTVATTETVFMTCGVPGVEPHLLMEAAETTREFVERFCR
jgi:DNA/RNA-binding domain of Phe-tRNA-synthetase-like protein